jgi:hypothetical protein
VNLDLLLSADRLLQVASVGAYVLGFAVAFRLVWARWRRSLTAYGTLETLIANRSAEIRRTARRTMALKREAAVLEGMARDAEQAARELERRLEDHKGVRRPVFVVSEVKRPGDLLYEAEVSHNPARPVAEAFRDGRRTCVVWAADERRAHARLASVYRDEAGYAVGPVRLRERMPKPA